MVKVSCCSDWYSILKKKVNRRGGIALSDSCLMTLSIGNRYGNPRNLAKYFLGMRWLGKSDRLVLDDTN